MNVRVLVGALLSLLCLAGCIGDAEHSNPLDPLSDSYVDAGSVQGIVEDRLFRPVAGAEVRLRASGADSTSLELTETDIAGNFRFDGVPAGTYRLQRSKQGYTSQEDTVVVTIGDLTLAEDATLNALPVLSGSAFSTTHISRWWPEDDLFLMEVQLSVVDPDDRPGIDSVWIYMPGAGALIQATPGIQPGSFLRVLPSDSLPGGSLHGLIGESTFVRVRDREGHVVLHPAAGPVRVIDQTPVALSPQGLETVPDPRPTLSWAPLDLPYAMTYRVEVVRDEANTDILVQEHADISADSLLFRLPSPLATGSYYWTVAVVDGHGNLSRSKEAGFRVN